MKKIGLLTTLLIGSLLLTGCSFHINFNDSSSVVDKDKPIIKTDSGRLFACNEEVGKYYNTSTFGGAWDTEEESGASFVLNGEITYEENGETITKNVQCVVDMVDESVRIYEIEKLAEEVDDIMNDEKLLSLYPGIQEHDWNVIIGDTLQSNYISGKNNLYYDPYRGIALKLGDVPDGGLIREIDTDEGGIPHSQIIFLVKGDENEENRTGINGYREMFTIAVVSKENLKNFGASLDNLPFKYATIG